MHCIWKLLNVFWLPMLLIHSSGIAQSDSLNKRLLHIEQRLFDESDSMSYDFNQLIFEKVEILALQGNYFRVISESKRLNKYATTDQKCAINKIRYDAFIRTNKSFELIAELKNQTLCEHDTALTLLRAIVYLENNQFDSFTSEIARIDSNASRSFNQVVQQTSTNTKKERKWLPAYHFSNRNYLKGTTTLFLHSLPPATFTASLLLAVPLSGVIIGTYLGWRIYGSNKASIEQIKEKNSRQESYKVILAGYKILEQLNKIY